MNRILLLVIAAFLLSGCIHPYVPTIHQGNVLSEQQIKQLKLGMSKDDVQYALGAPVLQNSIEPNRWDYIYTVKKEQKPIQEKRLTLYFKNDKLYKIDNVNYDATTAK
ncbi:MAG: hypothetical protein CMF49_09075 [Legionellales bacterium]|nr:hypothetical protein [Legionellales bacterium]|tara:strand:+ start:558 stop:881 length:324 start_codon:yes stop_codon:yes gene_type:complete